MNSQLVSTPHQLFTIPFSHYNERARFALDLAGIPYVEHGYAPIFHVVPLLFQTLIHGAKRSTSTPCLITNDKQVMHDSALIVKYANKILNEKGMNLYPDELVDQIAEVEKTLHDEMGVQARIYAYYHICTDFDVVKQMGYANFGPVQGILFSLLRKPIMKLVFTGLKVNKDTASAASERITDLFQTFSQRLEANGGEFLVGNQFTAADLTFASLSSIALGITHVNGYGAWLPDMQSLPSETQAQLQAWRQTPAGQHALKIYREFRTHPVNPPKFRSKQ